MNQEINNKKDKLVYDYEKLCNRERIVRNIIESINNSTDYKYLINNIIIEICTYFKTDRCVLLRVDESQTIQCHVDDFSECRANDNIKSMINFDGNDLLFQKMLELNTFYKTNKVNLINNKKIDSFLTINDMKGSEVEQYLIDFNINSYICLNVNYLGVIKAVITIHFSALDLDITDDDLQFLEDLSKYIALLLNQMDLYEKTKKKTEREKILTTIIESIRTSLDFIEVKKNIVNEVGKYFEADRCFLMQYDQKSMLPIDVDEFSEYRSSEKYASVVDFDFTDPINLKILDKLNKLIPKPIPSLIENYSNTHDYIKNNNLIDSDLDKFFKFFNMKAIACISIFYKNKIKGAIAIHWDKYNITIDEEQKNFLKEIANQAAITLEHADLYKEQQQQTKKEKLLISISNEIRSSLDIKKVSKSICEKTSNIFNTQEVHLFEFYYDNRITGKELNESSKTQNNYQFKSIISLFRDIFEKEKQINIDNIMKSNLPSPIKDYYEKQKVQSIIGIKYDIDNVKFGAIILHEHKYQRKWSIEEIKLLDDLGKQISFAIKHANTFSNLKEQLKKERFLKTDQSILINKNLAINTDLNSAMIYSIINNTYNYKKDLNLLTVDDFAEINIEELKKHSCLSIPHIRNSLFNLFKNELIDYRAKQNTYFIKIEDNKEIKIKYLKQIRDNKESKDKIDCYDFNSLSKNPTEIFSIDSVKAAKFYIEKCNQNPATVTKFYYSTLCRIFNEFIINYNLCINKLKLIIEYWFLPDKKINYVNENAILAKKLRQIFSVKLYVSQTLATDMSAKIDFSGAKFQFNADDIDFIK